MPGLEFIAAFILVLAAIALAKFYIYKPRTKVDSGTVQAAPALGAGMQAELDTMKNNVEAYRQNISRRREALKKLAG